MSEKTLRRKVIKALRPLHAIAVENTAYPGTPDINYVGGWMELKQVDKWPPRDGPLRLPHFTQQQKVWLRQRHRANGNAWLFLQVEQEYLLFTGLSAWNVGKLTRGELKETAWVWWDKFPHAPLLIETLSA